MASLESIFFRGYSNVNQVGVGNVHLDSQFKQLKRKSHSNYNKSKLVVRSAICTTHGANRSVSKSQEIGGSFSDWKSASSSLENRWVKQLEISKVIRDLQPPNSLHPASSSFQLSNIESSRSVIESSGLSFMSRRFSSIPHQPLSINSLTANKAKKSTALKVAHPGAAGAHSEAAAVEAFPDCESLPCGKFEIPFQAVDLGLADRAIFPIENSVGGSIHKNYDLLLQHRLHIVGEVQLPVRHCLLALPGTIKEELKCVISHPQALSQCEHNLSALGVRQEAVNDTAAAAQLVTANKLRDTGAIASCRAGYLYGLEILQSGFQDYSGNTTRFLIVAREPLIPGDIRGKSKTSIVFALENESEDLFRALSAFALRDISLTKIETRPKTRKPLLQSCRSQKSRCSFEHLFYVDFEASMAEIQAQNAVQQLEEVATFLRVLGCYPAYAPESIS